MSKVYPKLLARALDHNKEIKEKYAEETQHSIDTTIIYKGIKHAVSFSSNDDTSPSIVLTDANTVDAIHKYAKDGKICALNYASYKTPGGGYMKGMMAQEEYLCHHSNLYSVISAFDDYYRENNKDLNKGLYRDVALYSKDIIFDNKSKCDIITCAAPNIGFIYSKAKPEENLAALKSRIKMVLLIADRNGNDVFIAGAWGCGVFGQNAELVSKLFIDCIRNNTYENLKKIVFAIPNKGDGYNNYKMFAKSMKRANVYYVE